MPTLQPVATSPTALQRTDIANGVNSGGRDRIVVAVRSWKPTLHANQVGIVEDLLAAGHRLIYVSFGNPYHYQLFPALEVYFCGFSTHSATQKAAAHVLLGNASSDASSPVPLPVTLFGWLAE